MSPASSQLPRVAGDFLLVEKIAEGGMAEVFVARRLSDRSVPAAVYAVKCLHPRLAGEPGFVDMFVGEGAVASRLRHPCIVRTEAVVHADGVHLIAMEYLSGKDLRQLARHLGQRAQRLPVPTALWIVEHMLDALDYAHGVTDERGEPLRLVNRDVSPTNVVLTHEGLVKLIDFGIAQSSLAFGATQIGHVRGKIAYMSPEQVRGLPVDRRSDVFSAGIVLHELLSGRRLFVGNSDFALMEAVRTTPIPPPSSLNPMVDAELDGIVMRAVARDVGARYPGARELRDELEAYRRRRALDFGRGELAAFLAAEFPEQRRSEAARFERVCAAQPPTGPPRPPAAAAPARPEVRARSTTPVPITPQGHGMLPVVLGVLLGLAISAVIYWWVLVGLGD